MQKVAMYIDGFNFYYAIKKNAPLPIGLGWCDFRKLAEQYMMKPDSDLQAVKYFTAPVQRHGHEGEREAQDLWLQAVKTIPGITVIEGFHQEHDGKREEKQTDVKIAVELLLDALDPNGYDAAILVTADIDLAPAVIAVQSRIDRPKPVAVWIPPLAEYENWKYIRNTSKIDLHQIEPEMLADCRLPDKIKTGKGLVMCPAKWRMR